MKTLQSNWITEGTIDFEYKKYMLLAYLQGVQAYFSESKLYPCLSDLIAHYQSLAALKENQQQFKDLFPKELNKIDLKKLELEYEILKEDNEYLEEIAAILDYAMPKLHQQMKEGKELYEYIENMVAIEPIGIVPLRKQEGYMLVHNGENPLTKVYEYEVSIFEHSQEPYRAIRTSYLTDYTYSISNTFEAIKIDLIRNKKELPNPATFLIQTPKVFPIAESLMPIAKRSLIRLLEE